MNVRGWLAEFPQNRRTAERKRLAKAARVAEVTIRSWESELRRVSGEKIPRLERATEGGVGHYLNGDPFIPGLVGISGYDLRPDFGFRKPASNSIPAA